MASISGDYSTGLVAHWELEETSGTRVDSHGSYDLTDVNTVGSGTGKQGTCADFVRASSEMLTVSDGSDLELGSGDYSLSAWLRPDNTTNLQGVICKMDQSPSRGFTLIVNSGSFVMAHQGVDNFNTPAVTITAGNWYHIVCTYNATTDEGIMYINGTASTPKTLSYAPTASSYLALGNYGDGLSYYYDGLIDEVSIWKNRILSSGEVTAIYNSGNGIPYESATTSVTVTATVVSATINLPAPTIVAVRHVSVSVGVQDVTVNAISPTITVEIGAIVQADVQNITINAISPTIIADGNIIVTATTPAVTINLPTPTIVTVSSITVTPSVQAVTVSTVSPTINIGTSVTVSASAASVTMSAVSPTIVTVANTTCVATVVSIAVSVVSPRKTGGAWSRTRRTTAAGDWTRTAKNYS